MGMRAADYFPEVSATPDDHQVIFFRRKNCVLYQAPLQLGREKWSFWLGFSLDEISEIKKSLFSHALLLATFTMGGLGLVLFYMVRHFLQPVQDLTMGAAAMSDGQLSHRMPIRSKDEVGRLAEAFNQMAQSLQEKNQQIRQSQLRLQAVFDGIPDPLIMVDRDLRIKLLNQAALDYFQADSLESIVDKHCYQVLKGLAAPCAGCEVPAAVSQRGLLLCERKCARAPDRVEEVFVYPLPNASIQEGGSIIQICDVTEARNIERSLLQSGACPKLS
jgi:signal transduction histidine kinase